MPSDFFDRVPEFDLDGHRISAYVRSGNVSASGPAIVSNARWHLVVDGTEIDGNLEASADDTLETVKPHLIRTAREYLGK